MTALAPIGDVMTEGLPPGSSNSDSAFGREDSAETRAYQLGYCEGLLRRGGGVEEWSFEELRAEMYEQRREQQLDKKLKRLTNMKDKLNEELQKLQQQVLPGGSAPHVWDAGGPAASCQVDQEAAAAAAPLSGDRAEADQLVDNVFIRPDQTRISPRVQSLGPASKPWKDLSPIQELGVEVSSVSSLEGGSAGDCSPLQEAQRGRADRSPSPGGDQMDPLQLLERCDVTSYPGFHSEPRPLPPVREPTFQLGGEVYLILSCILDERHFSVYAGQKNDDEYVVIKVDHRAAPWDFHLFRRLKQNVAAAPPTISCFLFLDGCVTVYTLPPGHKPLALTEHTGSELDVASGAAALLQLVSQLHSCRLLHTALRPHILTCCHRAGLTPDWMFPVDWSAAVDLDLQRITELQQLPAAQAYISMGLLDPHAPPHLVDLVGVAETVHFLLTDSSMVVVKDSDGWMAERFTGDQHSGMFCGVWRTFFRSLLNAAGDSSLSIVSELTELLVKHFG